MRYIVKKAPPLKYTEWFYGKPLIGRKRSNCTYKDLRYEEEVINAVEESLLDEQGHLCCYTGILITNNYHVEHFKPQSHCENNEDVEYTNILAAYPAPNKTAPYGAQAKGSWYDPSLLISPLNEMCGTKFHFNLNGEITAINPKDAAAAETIKKLALDHKLLTGLRKQAIDDFRNKARSLSISKLKKISEHYSDVISGQPLPAFCFVIQPYAANLLKKAQQKRDSHITQNLQKKQRPAKRRKP